MIFYSFMAMTVGAIFNVLLILLLLRVIFGFMMLEGSPVDQFLFVVTEPVVSPMRKALSKSEFFASIPVDFSIQFTVIIIFILYTFMLY